MACSLHVHQAGCTGPIVFSMSESLLAGSVAVFCSVFGAVLNLVTIIALLNYSRTRYHVTTPFIVSLATSDLVFSSLTLPFLAIKFFARDWVISDEGGFFCQVFPVLFYSNSAITLFNLMCVTINRWVMIFRPSKSEKIFTRRNSKIIIALCWLVPPILLTPSLAGVYGRYTS